MLPGSTFDCAEIDFSVVDFSVVGFSVVSCCQHIYYEHALCYRKVGSVPTMRLQKDRLNMSTGSPAESCLAPEDMRG
jgi:hypothetical protein